MIEEKRAILDRQDEKEAKRQWEEEKRQHLLRLEELKQMELELKQMELESQRKVAPTGFVKYFFLFTPSFSSVCTGRLRSKKTFGQTCSCPVRGLHLQTTFSKRPLPNRWRRLDCITRRPKRGAKRTWVAEKARTPWKAARRVFSWRQLGEVASSMRLARARSFAVGPSVRRSDGPFFSDRPIFLDHTRSSAGVTVAQLICGSTKYIGGRRK